MRYADRQVVKVLARLDELGLAENTIVVVWGEIMADIWATPSSGQNTRPSSAPTAAS